MVSKTRSLLRTEIERKEPIFAGLVIEGSPKTPDSLISCNARAVLLRSILSFRERAGRFQVTAEGELLLSESSMVTFSLSSLRANGSLCSSIGEVVLYQVLNATSISLASGGRVRLKIITAAIATAAVTSAWVERIFRFAIIG